MKWTKTREKLAALIALAFMVVFGAIVGAYFGLPIPFVHEFLIKIGIL
jgi:hypothetical protein